MSKQLNRAKLLLVISCALFAFYVTFYSLINNPYQNAVTGAVYEMLAVPMLVLRLITAVYSVLFSRRNKGISKVYSLISFALIVSSIILVIIA